MSRIGEVVRATRKRVGLPQKEFGRTLTVSQSYISRVENGDEVPTPMFIKLFCFVYGVDEDTLLDSR